MGQKICLAGIIVLLALLPTALVVAQAPDQEQSTIIENVRMSRDNLEIFDTPSSTRGHVLFTVSGNFQVTAIATVEDQNWVQVVFCVASQPRVGWSRASRLRLEDEDLSRLTVISSPRRALTPILNLPCTPEMEIPGMTRLPNGVAVSEGNMGFFEVYDCVYIGDATRQEDLFRWYSAEAEVDENGVQIGQHEYVGGPFTGVWRNGCPGIPGTQ